MSTSRLLALPAELRNHIYELALTPSLTPCELYHAKPPSCALLQTSRQVHNEAKGMYEEACRKYWSGTLFTATQRRWQEIRQPNPRLSVLDDHQVFGLIRRVEVTANDPSLNTTMTLHRLDAGDAWKMEGHTVYKDGSDDHLWTRYLVAVPWDDKLKVSNRISAYDTEAEALVDSAGIVDGSTGHERAMVLIRFMGVR